jgi:hypothetical protein
MALCRRGRRGHPPRLCSPCNGGSATRRSRGRSRLPVRGMTRGPSAPRHRCSFCSARHAGEFPPDTREHTAPGDKDAVRHRLLERSRAYRGRIPALGRPDRRERIHVGRAHRLRRSCRQVRSRSRTSWTSCSSAGAGRRSRSRDGLRVSQPDDPFECEAVATAKAVPSGSAVQRAATGAARPAPTHAVPAVQRLVGFEFETRLHPWKLVREEATRCVDDATARPGPQRRRRTGRTRGP